jgi:hypothetical protein
LEKEEKGKKEEIERERKEDRWCIFCEMITKKLRVLQNNHSLKKF